jgi:hypothetical protein
MGRPSDNGVANFERVKFDVPESLLGNGSINRGASECVWIDSAKGQPAGPGVIDLEGKDRLEGLMLSDEIFEDSRRIEDADDSEAQSQQAVGTAAPVQVVSRSQATKMSDNVLREYITERCGLNS